MERVVRFRCAHGDLHGALRAGVAQHTARRIRRPGPSPSRAWLERTSSSAEASASAEWPRSGPRLKGPGRGCMLGMEEMGA
jgi:hypothetical protein